MPIWNFRRRPSATASGATATAHELKAAYEQGRRDERSDRKRHPVLMTCLVVLAAVGASLVTLAAVNGSFSTGGEVADQQSRDVVDAIAKTPTGRNDKPVEDVVIESVEVQRS